MWILFEVKTYILYELSAKSYPLTDIMKDVNLRDIFDVIYSGLKAGGSRLRVLVAGNNLDNY